MQQGEQRLVVSGLDERDRVQADALVGAVQPLVLDAEPGGGRDAEPGEVVADVGRPGDLRRRGESGLCRRRGQQRRRATASRPAARTAASRW